MSSSREELIPGLHDDVSLTEIATKLPWTALHALYSVSRSWQRAIHSHEVYGERLRCRSTETLVVFKYPNLQSPESGRDSVSLYSMREKTYYQLPPIPGFESGISRYSQLITQGGKLYVLGPESSHQLKPWLGDIYHDEFPLEGKIKIYVLDLAAQGQWERCTSLPNLERKYRFNIGFGFTVGSRHFVRGGCTDWFNSFWHVCDSAQGKWSVQGHEWRVTDPFQPLVGVPEGWWFTVQGKNYLVSNFEPNGVSHHKIDVYDFSTKSFTHQHSVSLGEVERKLKLRFH